MASGSLHDVVREACPRGLWSKGVKLAREGAVSGESEGSGETVLRVASPGRAVAATVVLYTNDIDWECDCSSKYEACSHVAAAVIALGDGTMKLKAAPKLVYRFETHGSTLLLRRVMVHEGGQEEELPASLMTLVSGRTNSTAGLSPSQDDLAIDRILQGSARAEPSPSQLNELFGHLAGCPYITINRESCTVAPDELLPRARVSDHGDGVRLAVEAAPELREIVCSGVGRVGPDDDRTLVVLGHTSVAGDRWQGLPIIRDYRPDELGQLATEMLPAVSRDVDVEIRTRRLPRAESGIKPRLDFSFEYDGDNLTILPTLVYGDPPLCRIDNDRMVQLRSPAPVRDRLAERSLIETLRQQLNMVPGHKIEVYGSDARTTAERVRTFQRGKDHKALAASIHNVELIPRLDVVNAKGGKDASFELWFEAEDPSGQPSRRISGTEVMAAWQSRVGVVPLGQMGWAPVPDSFLAKHGQQVLDLLAARDENGQVSRASLPSLARLCEQMEIAPPKAATELLKQLNTADKNLPPHEKFVGTLRQYQSEGVSWLAARREAGLGAVLADDMGLGKTVQALAAVPSGTLVICPTSVLPNWASEIETFRPGSTICSYHGSNRTLDTDADFVLTTYALLRIDREKLSEVDWAAIILDEAQAIKNPDSQTARAAFALRGSFRLALSGTPVENRLDELWSVCHATSPGLLGDRRGFQKRYVAPIAQNDPDAASRLHARISPFVLRRRKQQVAPELPPRTDSVLYVELEESERTVYDTVHAASRDDLVSKLSKGASAIEILEALLRLRQAACHPSLVPGHSAETSSKIACLLDHLDRAVGGGHKALVFSQWTSMLDLIEPHLKAAEIDFVRLDGSTRNRKGVVDRFQSDDGPPVLIASLKAGGTGLNLTAADHVFIVDPWWNPAVEDQAADRAHRIGQDKPVMIYRLVARDTVEERIEALKQAKRKLADAALGTTSGGITRDELANLL